MVKNIEYEQYNRNMRGHNVQGDRFFANTMAIYEISPRDKPKQYYIV